MSFGMIMWWNQKKKKKQNYYIDEMTVTGLEPRNDCNWTLYYIDTDTFIVYTKTEHIYGDIANITNSSNYELDRPSPELGAKICCIGSQNIHLFNRQQWGR